MIQLLPLALFGTVIVASMLAILATAKAEWPYVLRALGIEPNAGPPLRSIRAPRIRITRPLRGSASLVPERPSLRAA